MNTTEIFLDKYRELEVAVRYAYNLGKFDSAVSFLKKQKKFEYCRADIDYIADIRNLLSHNRKIDGEYAVQPSEQTIAFIDSIITEVQGRKKCRDICIRAEKILKKNLRGNVLDTIKTMHERNFTHVPIVENRRVIGVFSRNSIFSYVAENTACALAGKQTLTFGDIKDYLALTGREKDDYIFIKSTMYTDELQEIFDEEDKKGRRIGLIFLTAHGTADEPLLGMLTPWDVVKNS